MALGKILVLYDGSAAADGLLAMACETVRSTGCVMPLFVTRVPAVLPLAPLPHWFDREGQEALDRAEAVARRYGCAIDSWLVRSREPAEAIVAVARDGEADAVFLPQCSWRHPLRRFGDGVQARLVAHAAPCPVLIGTWRDPWREPVEHVAHGGGSYAAIAGLDGSVPPPPALHCRVLQPWQPGRPRLARSQVL
jgi:nucleotide-binding universal stress UspA family protein